MAKHGTELGVNLGELKACALLFLPAAASIYVDAANAVNESHGDRWRFLDGTGRDFMQPGAGGIVYPAWNQLRNELQRILAQSATNLYATADALIRIADLYANTDEESAQAISQMNQTLDGFQNNPAFTHADPAKRNQIPNVPA
jgi:hypothetical protein